MGILYVSQACQLNGVSTLAWLSECSACLRLPTICQGPGDMLTFRDILKHVRYQIAKEVPLFLSPLNISLLETQYGGGAEKEVSFCGTSTGHNWVPSTTGVQFSEKGVHK